MQRRKENPKGGAAKLSENYGIAVCNESHSEFENTKKVALKRVKSCSKRLGTLPYLESFRN